MFYTNNMDRETLYNELKEIIKDYETLGLYQRVLDRINRDLEPTSRDEQAKKRYREQIQASYDRAYKREQDFINQMTAMS